MTTSQGTTFRRTYIGALHGLLLAALLGVAACGGGGSVNRPSEAPSGERAEVVGCAD